MSFTSAYRRKKHYIKCHVKFGHNPSQILQRLPYANNLMIMYAPNNSQLTLATVFQNVLNVKRTYGIPYSGFFWGEKVSQIICHLWKFYYQDIY